MASVDLRERMLELAHEGHPGIFSMETRLRSKVWWPGIDKSIEAYCRSCYGCQLVSQPSKPEPMTRTKLPSAPWQHLHVGADLLRPLPTDHYIFVLVDYYIRYFEVQVTKTITSEKSQHFKDFISENEIIHPRTTSLWPHANGEVERQNQSIMKRIRIEQ